MNQCGVCLYKLLTGSVLSFCQMRFCHYRMMGLDFSNCCRVDSLKKTPGIWQYVELVMWKRKPLLFISLPLSNRRDVDEMCRVTLNNHFRGFSFYFIFFTLWIASFQHFPPKSRQTEKRHWEGMDTSSMLTEWLEASQNRSARSWECENEMAEQSGKLQIEKKLSVEWWRWGVMTLAEGQRSYLEIQRH